MMKPEEILRQMKRRIASGTFLVQLMNYLKQAGAKLAYVTLLLYYAYHGKDTPSWAKRTILGSIAYLLAPLDLVPDLTPFFGFTDDFGILMFGLVSIAGHINREIREKAQGQVASWFPNTNSDLFTAIDKKL